MCGEHNVPYGELIDVSLPLGRSIPLWPGAQSRFEHTFVRSLSRGDRSNVSRIEMNVHTGTHVDAPLHYIAGGRAVDELDVRPLIGPAMVYDLTGVDTTIGADDLAVQDVESCGICLLKTRNSDLWGSADFDETFVGLSPAAADYLVRCDVSVVGIDYLSVESILSSSKHVHKKLLSRGVILVEGLDFRRVEPGKYFFMCLPLSICGAEAAPARALLLRSWKHTSCRCCYADILK